MDLFRTSSQKKSLTREGRCMSLSTSSGSALGLRMPTTKSEDPPAMSTKLKPARDVFIQFYIKL